MLLCRVVLVVALDATTEVGLHRSEADAEYGVTGGVVVRLDHGAVGSATLVGHAHAVPAVLGPVARAELPCCVVEPRRPCCVVRQEFDLRVGVAPEGALAVRVDVRPSFDGGGANRERLVDTLRVRSGLGRRRTQSEDHQHCQPEGCEQASHVSPLIQSDCQLTW